MRFIGVSMQNQMDPDCIHDSSVPCLSSSLLDLRVAWKQSALKNFKFIIMVVSILHCRQCTILFFFFLFLFGNQWIREELYIYYQIFVWDRELYKMNCPTQTQTQRIG